MQMHIESIYGFYHGQDPRTFSPDEEPCTEKELETHRQACKEAESGEWKRDDSGCHSPRPGVLVHKTSMGIGVYQVVMDENGDYVRDATYDDILHEGEWREES